MDNLTYEQAKDLAKYYASLALSVAVFRYNNWQQLTEAERLQLTNQHWSLENLSQDYIDQATDLVFENVEQDLERIREITEDINKTIDKLAKVQKVINVIGAALELGGAIIAKDPGLIVDKIDALVSAYDEEAKDAA